MRADLILCYKILHDLVSLDYTKLFVLVSNVSTRGHRFKLRSPVRPRLDTRRHFYGYRVISAWNGLSELCVEAPNVLAFKNLLNTEDLSKSLQNHYEVFFSK